MAQPPPYIGIVYPQPMVEALINIVLTDDKAGKPLPLSLHWVMQIQHAIAARGWPAGYAIPRHALGLNQVGNYRPEHNLVCALASRDGSTWIVVLFQLSPDRYGHEWSLSIVDARFHGHQGPLLHNMSLREMTRFIGRRLMEFLP